MICDHTLSSLKQEGYYRNIRYDLVEMVPLEAKRILDIGCGFGLTGRYLAQRNQAEVAGVEIDKKAVAAAKKNLNLVFEGDIESVNFDYWKERYDCIVCGDVLEHLRDPLGTLIKLRSWINPNGCLVASIPNVRNYNVSIPLILFGRWEYQESGILDSTHLRFFTKRTIEIMFEKAGYIISQLHCEFIGGTEERVIRGINRVTFGIIRDILTNVYLVKVSPQSFDST